MSPELLKILSDLVKFMVQRPAEVQLLAAMTPVNSEAVSALLKEAGDIASTVENDAEATSAILQRLFAKRGELLPKPKPGVHKHYASCETCGHINKIELKL